MMVSFGQVLGPIKPFDPAVLSSKGSLFLTRPTLMTYTEKREDLVAHAQDLFEVVIKGVVNVRIKQLYSLSDAAKAHQDLESRKTTGSSVLIP
jgi:NADPH2:quinone reductase